MFFDRQTANKLQFLVNPETEQAILLMLDSVIAEKSQILDNLETSEASLRQFQGQLAVLKELKDYKQRIYDGLKNG